MDVETTKLSIAIGAKIKQRRLARSWTLDQLTQSSGVSRRMLINVEKGAVNPSVGTLLRISDALGIGLPSLVESPRSAPVTVVRSGEAPALWTGPAGGLGLLVAGTHAPNVVDLWDWTLLPGERHSSEAHVAGTQELLQCRSGTITLHVGEEELILQPDDAVSFASDVAHAYANPGVETARFSLAVFEPGVGTVRDFL